MNFFQEFTALPPSSDERVPLFVWRSEHIWLKNLQLHHLMLHRPRCTTSSGPSGPTPWMPATNLTNPPWKWIEMVKLSGHYQIDISPMHHCITRFFDVKLPNFLDITETFLPPSAFWRVHNGEARRFKIWNLANNKLNGEATLQITPRKVTAWRGRGASPSFRLNRWFGSVESISLWNFVVDFFNRLEERHSVFFYSGICIVVLHSPRIFQVRLDTSFI